MNDWHKWFAWHPVWTLSGRLVWLKTIERRWNWELNWIGDMSGHGVPAGGYEYRLQRIEWLEPGRRWWWRPGRG